VSAGEQITEADVKNPCAGVHGPCNPRTKEVDDYVTGENEKYLKRSMHEVAVLRAQLDELIRRREYIKQAFGGPDIIEPYGFREAVQDLQLAVGRMNDKIGEFIVDKVDSAAGALGVRGAVSRGVGTTLATLTGMAIDVVGGIGTRPYVIAANAMDSYTDEGGGVAGVGAAVLQSVNEVNPVYQGLVANHKREQAVERGDRAGAWAAGFETVSAVASTFAFAGGIASGLTKPTPAPIDLLKVRAARTTFAETLEPYFPTKAQIAAGRAMGAEPGVVVRAGVADLVERSATSLGKTRGQQIIGVSDIADVGANQVATLVAHHKSFTALSGGGAEVGGLLQKLGFRAKAVELLSCQTAKNGFAQDLANQLGVPVRAPLGNVRIIEGIPRVRMVTDLDYLPAGQGWRTFTPEAVVP